MNIYQDSICETLGLRSIFEVNPLFNPDDKTTIEPFEDNTPRGSSHPCYGLSLSKDHIEAISLANKGKIFSKTHRKNISEALKNNENAKTSWTEKRRKLHSEIRKGELNPFFNKTHTNESIEKIKKANIGKKHTEETKAKMSESSKGERLNFRKENHPLYGKERPQEVIDKIRSKALKRSKVECPHCKKKISVNVANRWHFSNCNANVDL